ncbi:MAG: hypothetical protein ABI239_02500 [Aquihabitans sp.]
MTPLIKTALAGVLLFSLVGCSSDKSDDAGSTAATTTVVSDGGDASDTPVSPPSTGLIDRDPVPEGTAIIETTEMNSCDTKPGDVKASGTVRLPEGMEPGTVMVSVTWRNATTATVLARSRVEVENVTADATTDWEATNVLPDNDVPVDCVLAAVVGN